MKNNWTRLIALMLLMTLAIGSIPTAALMPEKGSNNDAAYLAMDVRDSLTGALRKKLDGANDSDLFEVILWLEEPQAAIDAPSRIARLGDTLPESPVQLIDDEEFAKLKELAITDYDAYLEYEPEINQEALKASAAQAERFNNQRMAIVKSVQDAMLKSNTDILGDVVEVLKTDASLSAKADAIYKDDSVGITYVSDLIPGILATLSKEQIEAVKELDRIIYIDIFENKVNAENKATILSDVQSTYIRTNNSLTGSGVKIGIIEGAYPSTSLATTVTNPGFTAIPSATHANTVADIIKTAAPNSTRYATIAPYYNAIVPGASLLVSKGCSIINMSLGGEGDGSYNSYAKMIDYIVSTYGVTFVTTTGNYNNDKPNLKLTDFAYAYNAIVVGGYYSGTFQNSAYSYIRDYGTRYSPDTMAYGWVSNSSGYSGVAGSSFAAPAVAGCIAQLTQRWANVSTNPAMAKALVLASGYNKIAGDTTWGDGHVEGNPAFSYRQGSGKANARYMLEMINGNRVLSWPSMNPSSSWEYERKVTVTSSDVVLRVALAWMQPTTSQTGSLEGGLRDYDIELYDPRGNQVDASWGSENNAELLEYRVNGNYGEYTIRITYYGGGNGNGTLALAYW